MEGYTNVQLLGVWYVGVHVVARLRRCSLLIVLHLHLQINRTVYHIYIYIYIYTVRWGVEIQGGCSSLLIMLHLHLQINRTEYYIGFTHQLQICNIL